MFVAGISTFEAGLFGALSMFVAIFSAIKVFAWTATFRRGRITFSVPVLYVLIFLFLFVFGGMTGVAVATSSLDVHWHDTYFIVAHFHFIMVGATLTAYFAALHYWFPKFTGRMYPERIARVAAVLVGVGFCGTFIPQFLLGNAGMPRRYYSYPAEFQSLHIASTIGAGVLATGMVLTLAYLAWAVRRGAPSGDNPWHSRSFEWRTPAPPPRHNYAEPPVWERDAYSYEDDA
jgi:cytochrome c oxidase subunit 1